MQVSHRFGVVQADIVSCTNARDTTAKAVLSWRACVCMHEAQYRVSGQLKHKGLTTPLDAVASRCNCCQHSMM
jgi:hypothetical protein